MVRIFLGTSALWDWFHKIILMKSFIRNNRVSYLQKKVRGFTTEGTMDNKNHDLSSVSVIASQPADVCIPLLKENEKGK